MRKFFLVLSILMFLLPTQITGHSGDTGGHCLDDKRNCSSDEYYNHPEDHSKDNTFVIVVIVIIVIMIIGALIHSRYFYVKPEPKPKPLTRTELIRQKAIDDFEFEQRIYRDTMKELERSTGTCVICGYEVSIKDEFCMGCGAYVGTRTYTFKPKQKSE